MDKKTTSDETVLRKRTPSTNKKLRPLKLDPEAEARSAKEECAELAESNSILDRLMVLIQERGLVGEENTVKILYLAMTSRLLDRPISVAVKGPSASGKSFVVRRVLDFFPEDGYREFTSMSERALVYSEEPLKHRMLVFYEDAALNTDFASYIVRSLLSEGCLKYETVESTDDGLRPRRIEREGPTGLIITTTKVSLHAENETRLISITVTDTQEQTSRILTALAEDRDRGEVPSEWTALQRWIEYGERRVVIPYAITLSEIIPPLAVRLRRDFKALLGLVKAHAILCQATRKRDSEGRIVASLEDYAVVRDLVASLFAEAVESTVPKTVRETVEAVDSLREAHKDCGVPVRALARELELDRSAVYRRARVAMKLGYLQNLETKKGRSLRLETDDLLPKEQEILPTSEELEKFCCSDAVASEG